MKMRVKVAHSHFGRGWEVLRRYGKPWRESGMLPANWAVAVLLPLSEGGWERCLAFRTIPDTVGQEDVLERVQHGVYDADYETCD